MEDLILFCYSKTIRGWTIVPHGPHFAGGQRHVHITKKNLGGSYSWNLDGSRHDEHRFPKSEKWIKEAKRIVAEQLGVSETSLSFLTSFDQKQRISILVEDESGKGRTIFSRYIRSGESTYIFGTPLGMAVYTANRFYQTD